VAKKGRIRALSERIRGDCLINGGSSSIKFALFRADHTLSRNTDEEWMIAKTVCRIVGLSAEKGDDP
jgi:acetate kinase